MASVADGSEDVNDFLQRIKELGDRRDQEDEERNRKLEEEILQGRKERQARRSGRLFHIVSLVQRHVPSTSRASNWESCADHELSRTRQIHFPNQILSCEHANRVEDISGTPSGLISSIVPQDRLANPRRASTRDSN
jgi:hypothetical protein